MLTCKNKANYSKQKRSMPGADQNDGAEHFRTTATRRCSCSNVRQQALEARFSRSWLCVRLLLLAKQLLLGNYAGCVHFSDGRGEDQKEFQGSECPHKG